MIEAFFVENDQFSRFSTEHFIMLIVGCITAAVLIFWGRRASEDRQVAVGAVMGYVIGEIEKKERPIISQKSLEKKLNLIDKFIELNPKGGHRRGRRRTPIPNGR
mgnify:CR=1 FL=1